MANHRDRQAARTGRISAEVLMVDPNPNRVESAASFLRLHGVLCHHAANGRSGLRQLLGGGLDAVILDTALPDLDGFQLLGLIRERAAVPVVVLTKGGDLERARSLELGADDSLTNPFSLRELLARLRAIFRRSQPDTARARLEIGEMLIDSRKRQVTLAARPVALTELEFELLLALVRRRGRVVPRASLLSLAGRGHTEVSERSIDVHISRLRKKLGAWPAGNLIHTVRGVGYVLNGSL